MRHIRRLRLIRREAGPVAPARACALDLCPSDGCYTYADHCTFDGEPPCSFDYEPCYDFALPCNFLDYGSS